MVGGPRAPDYAARIEETSDEIVLDDGRTLAYCTFGDPDGAPVVVFHGGVGSRGFGLLFEDAARRLGARIISPDRPGYGRSDPAPDRRLLDWPADVAALADALGHDRVPVLGVSGGGPYAAACAHALPDRVSRSALVSSLGPPEGPRSLGIRLIVRLARWAPWLVAIPIGRQLDRAAADPEAAARSRARGKAAPEAAMHRGDAGLRLAASTAEAGRQGRRHAVREIALVGGDWGFSLSAIDGPVDVWHGTLDRTVGVETAEYLANAIPSATLELREEVGHLSLPVTQGEAILERLLAN